MYSVIRYPEKRTAPAAEALQHFQLVVPEGAVAEGEQAATVSVVDAPAVPAVKVSGQGPGCMGARGAGEMEKNHCGRAVKS